ncbi:hypothetical protein FNV43_RR07482 [Rhamnella rubrinervis]|uniref:Uncharacterized protein n=1 Tax=Rhamnella rubrinervis TaxID=2594499 RepID=A0A8K0MMF1_9ROSA|nr:hypothetical protein FNV43_RR07482 [Rhamnella rubrinervis]
MCSYSGSDGGGNDGNNNNGGRPQKRQRLPKRGPGVAELEKILREQEKKNDQIEGFPSCFVPPLSSNDHHLSSRPSHDPTLPWTNLNNSSLLTTTRRVPFVPHLDHHRQTSTTSPPQPTVLPPPPNMYGNNGNNTSILLRPFGGVGSAGVNLPEHALFPVTWSTTSTTTPSNSNTTTHEGKIYSDTGGNNIALPTTDHPLWSSMQNKHYQNPNSLTSQFPGYASSSSSTPSSVGLYNPIEPPSSQTSYHNYPSMPPHQEDKVAGMKRRSQSFSVDNPPGPIFQSQVPRQPLPHMRRPVDQPPHYNVELSKTMLPRDVAKSDHDPLELNLHNHDTIYGAPPPPPHHHHQQPNFMKFNPSTNHVPPSVLQTNSQERQYYSSKCNAPSFQGNMEEYISSHGRSEAAGSDFNKPLYSFLVSKEQMGTKEDMVCMNNNGSEPADSEDQGIDLNLKL